MFRRNCLGTETLIMWTGRGQSHSLAWLATPRVNTRSSGADKLAMLRSSALPCRRRDGSPGEQSILCCYEVARQRSTAT